MLTNLYQRLRHFQHRWRLSASTQQPLLDDSALQSLQQFARSSHTSPLIPQRDVQQLLLGERLSAFTGSGYEFAENRLFQAGDDARFINWRLYARTGEIYRKVFHEERRPQLWLVIDRRNNMRFATRTRLKVTAAVRQALVNLYQAQQQQIAVGAVLLENPPQWFEAKSSASAQQHLVHAMISACPPLHDTGEGIAMEHVVRQLQHRLQAGSIVILLSDFHDLRQDNIAELYHLAQHHTVNAVHVLDEIELRLPNRGRFQLADSSIPETTQLDCNDTAYREKIEHQLQLRQEQVEQWLSGAGVRYQRLLTTDEPFSVSEEAPYGVA